MWGNDELVSGCFFMDKQDKVYVTRIAKTWLDEDNIINVKILPNVEITLKDAQDCLEVGSLRTKEISSSTLLIDMAGIQSISRAARLHFSNPPNNSRLKNKAIALIISSAMSKLIDNFFIGLNRPQIPIKIFTNIASAREWLKGTQK